MTLRDELEAVRYDRTPNPFHALDALARRTVFKLPRGAPEPEDLRQLFLTGLLPRKAGRRRETGALDALLELDDRHLTAAVANRLRQLGLEGMQDHNAHRALAQHVTRALAEPDTRPAAPPGSLRLGARFSYEAIKQAVDWLQAEQAREQRAAGLRGEPRRLAEKEVLRLLRSKYPLFDQQVGEKEPPRRREGPSTRPATAAGARHRRTSVRPSTFVRRKLDGEVLLRRLEGRLPHEKLDVLRRRLRGDGYEEIASALRIGLATAHAWCKEAEAQLRAVVKSDEGKRLSVGTVKHALREVAARKSRG
jgi:DNA-directed RNA polymerase specialized sigma24 family protein